MTKLQNEKLQKICKLFYTREQHIIDEVSMVACHHLAMISNRLNTAKHSDPNDPFGGVDIIFLGDLIFIFNSWSLCHPRDIF